jgi:tetratricopeptide (TPR) repeat protein
MAAQTTIDLAALPRWIPEFLKGGTPPLQQREADAIYAIGHAYYARDQFGPAADLFRLLVLCRPQESRGWFSLAACHEASGDDDRAISLYEIAIAAPTGREDRLRAHVYLARMMLRLGRRNDAREHVSAILRLRDELDDSSFDREMDDVVTKLEEHVS